MISVPKSGKSNKERMLVPCGKCLSCLSNRRADWSFRLNEELRDSETAHFITLTYDDENLPLGHNDVPTLYKKDIQDFIKRLRFEVASKHNKKIRYYVVGEYGSSTKRPHYHGIFFGIPNKDIEGLVLKKWNNGHVDIGKVTPASIHYTTKYIIQANDRKDERREPEFSLMSKRPAIGHKYIGRAEKWHIRNQYFHVISGSGIKQNLPRYYRDKIFDDWQKMIRRAELNYELPKLEEEELKRYEKISNNPYQEQVTRKQAYLERIKKKLKNNETL